MSRTIDDSYMNSGSPRIWDCESNEVSPSVEGLFLIVNFFQAKNYERFILDTESLIGIMGNEHISFKSQSPMSGLAGLEPGNV